MDKNKKLSEELLKIDGIDPANITETERQMFKTMLDKEMKHLNQKSWRSVGLVWITTGLWWIFVLGLLGLVLADQVLGKFHIPIIITWVILMLTLGILIFRKQRDFFRQINDSGRKVQKLHLRTYGKHKGFALVCKKNGKKCINWPNVLIFSLVIWLIAFVPAIGVYHLLGSFGIGSIQTTIPMEMIIKITIAIFIFVTLILSHGLKAPLEDLEEIKSMNYTFGRRKSSFAAIAIILAFVFIGIYFSGGSIDGASTAFAKALKNADNMPWVHMVSTSEIIKEDSPLASGAGDSEKWINIQSKISINIYGKVVHFSDFSNKINYTYKPNENVVAISAISTTWEQAVKYKSNSDLLSTLLQIPEQFEGSITRKTGQYQNRTVDIYQINADIDLTESFAFNASFEAVVDKATNLIIVVFEKISDSSGEHIGNLEISFSYPETGPKDIYELGVPNTAEVINYLNQSQE